MATSIAVRSGPKADMNITPLIDVLLVLLIIFMLITPALPQGVVVAVPQPNRNAAANAPQPLRTIVIQVAPGGVLHINQEAVTEEQLGPRLAEIFKTRAEKVCFVKGSSDLEFRDIARVIDIAKGAGVDKIGLITARMEHM